MGFFSWNCRHCGHSIMNPYVVDSETSWKNECVALFSDGRIVEGDYDGYGRIGDSDEQLLYWKVEVDLQHKRCWEKAGKPGYKETSKDAEGQGHFFDDGEPELAP